MAGRGFASMSKLYEFRTDPYIQGATGAGLTEAPIDQALKSGDPTALPGD